MAHIKFESVGIEFPIYNATARSLTSRLLEVATGGRLDRDPDGRVLVRSLQNVNFEIAEGERVGLLGHNGSGKSTLLRALSRVYKPQHGKAEIEGDVTSLIDISLGINPEATGRENIFLRGALLGIPKAQIEQMYEDIVDFSDLGNFIEMPMRTYSSGMQLRLAFSISTVVRPEILLMDEWLSVGDASFVHKAEQRLAELVSTSKILVIASHSRSLIEKTCTRAIWLEHGAIKLDGPVQEVTNAYWGRPPQNVIDG